jgi:hypothetical protein
MNFEIIKKIFISIERKATWPPKTSYLIIHVAHQHTIKALLVGEKGSLRINSTATKTETCVQQDSIG